MLAFLHRILQRLVTYAGPVDCLEEQFWSFTLSGSASRRVLVCCSCTFGIGLHPNHTSIRVLTFHASEAAIIPQRPLPDPRQRRNCWEKRNLACALPTKSLRFHCLGIFFQCWPTFLWADFFLRPLFESYSLSLPASLHNLRFGSFFECRGDLTAPTPSSSRPVTLNQPHLSFGCTTKCSTSALLCLLPPSFLPLLFLFFFFQLLHCYWPLYESGGLFFHKLFRQVCASRASP